jgi:orotidine 5'-phosphate decarboxylase subfamily 2
MSDERDAGDGGESFNERLDRCVRETGSLLCVGLDPHPGRVSEPLGDWCRRIIDATWESAVAFKPNSAFFEIGGPRGMEDLQAVARHMPEGRILVLDAKRGDIGSTASAYAQAAFDVYEADAVTVSPYLGGDSLEPFLADPAKGAFVLCHTSNPGAADLQHLRIDGRPLYLEVARRAAELWNGANNLGLVVGATWADALAEVRAVAPALPFLVPGIGAQGGDLKAAVQAGADANGRGLLISSSREIIFAADPGDAARRVRDAIAAVR